MDLAFHTAARCRHEQIRGLKVHVGVPAKGHVLHCVEDFHRVGQRVRFGNKPGGVSSKLIPDQWYGSRMR